MSLTMFEPTPNSSHTGDPAQLVRTGRVVSVDLAQANCRVEIGDPEEQSVETADVPWLTGAAGETRIFSPPSIGEQVLLLCPGGDIAQGIAMRGLFCNQFANPGISPREFIRFNDGAEFAYDPETQHCDIDLPAGATLSINSAGGIMMTGDVTIEGDLTLQGDMDASGDVVASGTSLTQHVHTNVTAGSAVSGAPQ